MLFMSDLYDRLHNVILKTIAKTSNGKQENLNLRLPCFFHL
jgi:hypothetical protein